jgi:hypothetical protein
MKVFGIAAMSSVYLMQAPCTTYNGVSIIPNVGLGFSIADLTGGLL